jgi:hypothetical protein
MVMNNAVATVVARGISRTVVIPFTRKAGTSPTGRGR